MTKSIGDTETFTTAHQIEDWHDLNAVREDLEANYLLMNDLDEDTDGYEEHASETANNGKGWNPIGGWGDKFSGSFDGQYYEIKDMNIERPEEELISLFSYIDISGEIKNVGMVDLHIVGGDRTSGLASINDGVVKNCHTTGIVKGGYYVSGLISNSIEGEVHNSYADVEVDGTGYVGGLIGFIEGVESLLKNSYSVGGVSGSSDFAFGSLVGRNDGTIKDSFALEQEDVPLVDIEEGKQVGRVTEAPEEDMKNIDLYTENGFKDYDNLNEAWDIEETNNRSDEIWYIHNTYDYPKLGSPEYYFLEIIIEGDGITVPEEGAHKYDIDEVVELNAFEELIDTPSYIETRLLDNLPEFYNKAKLDPKFDVWYKKFEDGWIEHSREKETEIVMDENKTLRAIFTETEQSNFNALMESIGKEIEEYMIVLQDVLEAHFVDEAEDKQLDEIGQMWGLRRIPNETDTSFRERIKAYAPGFGGGGTFDDLNRTLKWYVGEDNFYIEEFDEEIQPDNRVEKVDAVEEKIGDDAVWENGDEIKFYYKPENINTIVSVKDINEEDVTFTVNYEDGIITLDENVEDRFVYIEYEFNELTQYGRFKIFIDPTKDTLVSIDRIKFEIDKYKAGGIIVEFGALEFPTEDETISVDEDENIEGHMVDVTFVDDANLVLEDD